MKVAWPLLRVFVPQPLIVVPSEVKFTVPAGAPAPGVTAATVAVKVTRLAEDRRVELVAAKGRRGGRPG